MILLIAKRRSKDATRRNLIVVATGAIVAAPALLLGGALVKDNLGYILDGFTVPPKAHETQRLETLGRSARSGGVRLIRSAADRSRPRRPGSQTAGRARA